MSRNEQKCPKMTTNGPKTSKMTRTWQKKWQKNVKKYLEIWNVKKGVEMRNVEKWTDMSKNDQNDKNSEKSQKCLEILSNLKCKK